MDKNFEHGYYQGVIQAVDMNDKIGQCFNCNEADTSGWNAPNLDEKDWSVLTKDYSN